MKRGINIENIVLSLKIPIKLVINKAGEFNAFIDSGEREIERVRENCEFAYSMARDNQFALSPNWGRQISEAYVKKID